MFGLGQHKHSVLEGLAPVIGGVVGRDEHLRGRVGQRGVDVSLERIDPTPLTTQRFNPMYADVIHLRLDAHGATPWYVRAEFQLLGGGYAYEFVREVAASVLMRFNPMRDLVAVADPAVETRLAEAGLLDAITRLAPPSGPWLPRVRFTPDPRAAMMERMRGVPVPAGVTMQSDDGEASFGLLIDVPREVDGPSPAQFAAMLQAAVSVAELIERVDPAA